ncbi:MAG: hypothetical protein QMC24_12400 [Akkermansiaceae bacterium]
MSLLQRQGIAAETFAHVDLSCRSEFFRCIHQTFSCIRLIHRDQTDLIALSLQHELVERIDIRLAGDFPSLRVSERGSAQASVGGRVVISRVPAMAQKRDRSGDKN